MTRWRQFSLTLRVTFLFSVLVFCVVSSLGTYLYFAAQSVLQMRADYALIGRIEHYRNLFRDLNSLQQMKESPALFEGMLGNEQDVRIFRRPGEQPFIYVNPANMPVPKLAPLPVDVRLSVEALVGGERPDGIRVRWASVLAELGHQQGKVEITVAYAMTEESKVLERYRSHLIIAIIVTVLLTSALGYLILRSGLQPLLRIISGAGSITPKNLSARLHIGDAPTELHNLAEAINSMLGRLESGFQSLSQFSSDLAHEIRTPVNILMGQTQVALGQQRSWEEYEILLESNLEELTRLSRIIENILFLANADHANLTVEKERLSLADELGKVAEYFEGMADEREMRFDAQAAGHIFANSTMWRRAVNNLVINAIRYGRSGSVIRLASNECDSCSEIVVENECDPLPEGLLDHMFNRFYRGDKSRTEFTESNGLGLSIVKAIVTLHGGSVDVAYTAESSSIRFVLRFPLARA